MNIENVKRVTLTNSEAEKITEVIKMIIDIAEEFDDYTWLEIFDRLLDNYSCNEDHIDTEIYF